MLYLHDTHSFSLIDNWRQVLYNKLGLFESLGQGQCYRAHISANIYHNVFGVEFTPVKSYRDTQVSGTLLWQSKHRPLTKISSLKGAAACCIAATNRPNLQDCSGIMNQSHKVLSVLNAMLNGVLSAFPLVLMNSINATLLGSPSPTLTPGY